jgi:hypothetical protein
VNEDGDLPIPNQLTIDHDSNIYYPGGSALNNGGLPVILKGIVTEGPFTIDYTGTITGLVSEGSSNSDKSLCVTLDPTHNTVYTYGVQSGEDSDEIFMFDTATLTQQDVLALTTINVDFTGHYNPYNMETDSNLDSLNYGYMYCIINDVTYACIGWTIGFAASGYQTTIIEEGDEPLTIDIDEGILPVYYFTERVTHVGGQLVNRFNPGLPGALLVEIDQQILTVPINSPTHADTDRDSVSQDYFTGTSLGVESDMFMREKADKCSGAESNLAQRDDYQMIFVGGRRELYQPPT